MHLFIIHNYSFQLFKFCCSWAHFQLLEQNAGPRRKTIGPENAGNCLVFVLKQLTVTDSTAFPMFFRIFQRVNWPFSPSLTTLWDVEERCRSAISCLLWAPVWWFCGDLSKHFKSFWGEYGVFGELHQINSMIPGFRRIILGAHYMTSTPLRQSQNPPKSTICWNLKQN